MTRVRRFVPWVSALLMLAGLARFIQNGLIPATRLSLGDFRASFPTEYFAWLRPDFPTTMVWPGWTYGPVLHFVTLPLFLVPRWSMVGTVWAAVNLCALMASFVYACRLSGAERRVSWNTLAVLLGLWCWFKPLQSCFEQGNIEILEMAVTLAAVVRFTRGRETDPGVLLGTATMMKFAPVGFLGWMGLRGRWRVVNAGFITIVLLAAAAQLTLGWENNGLWLRSLWLRGVPQINADTQTVISTFLHRAGVLDLTDGYFLQRWFPDARAAVAARAGSVASLAFACGFGALLWLRRRSRVSPVELSALFVPMILLPTSNHQYYFIFALIPFTVLFLRAAADRQWGLLSATLICYLLLSPPLRLTGGDLHAYFQTPFFYVLHYNSVMAYGALGLWAVATYQMLGEPDALPRPWWWRGAARWVVVAAVIVISGVGVSSWWQGRARRHQPVASEDLVVAAGLRLSSTASLAMSADGTRLAFVTNDGRLCARELATRAERCWDEHSGADRLAADPSGPFFSSDGRWIGFFSRGYLRKVPAAGGAVEAINGGGGGLAAEWLPDESILYASVTGIMRMRPRSTAEVLVPQRPDEGRYTTPTLSASGQTVYFTILPPGGSRGAGTIVAQSLVTGQRKVLGVGINPRVDRAGRRLLFVQGRRLVAVAFRNDELEIEDLSVPVATDVFVSGNGGAAYGVSTDDTLAYVTDRASEGNAFQFIRVDRTGHEEPLPIPPQPVATFSLSPNGRYLAASVMSSETDIWVWDLVTGRRERMAADANANDSPIFIEDGATVAFTASGSPLRWSTILKSRLGDGGRINATVWDAGSRDRLSVPLLRSVAPDGTLVGTLGGDLWFHGPALSPRISVVHTPTSVDQTQVTITAPAVSPDGKWIAYSSNRTGKYQVWVQPFPALDRFIQVSVAGGTEPVWSRDGRELVFRGWHPQSNTFGVWAVAVTPGASAQVSTQARLFDEPREWGVLAGFAMEPDGRHFIMIRRVESPADTPLRVVRRWAARLVQ